MLGAIIGDTIGSIYEFNNVRRKDVELTFNIFFILGIKKLIKKMK